MDLRHIAGKDNNITDALFHTSIHAISAQMGIDYAAMASDQKGNEDIQAYRTAITGLVFEDVKFGPHASTLLRDVSTGQPRQ